MFQAYNREHVYMGDNNASKIVGIGRVKVAMFDGMTLRIDDV